MLQQSHLIDMFYVASIVQRPFDEGIAGPVTVFGLGLVLILNKDSKTIIEHQLS